jgi:hypothetical protein
MPGPVSKVVKIDLLPASQAPDNWTVVRGGGGEMHWISMLGCNRVARDRARSGPIPSPAYWEISAS